MASAMGCDQKTSGRKNDLSPVSFRLTDGESAAVKAWCAKHGLTLQQFVEQAVRHQIEAEGKR